MAEKLLDRMRRIIRVRHYSLRTEKAYLHWARRFILFMASDIPQKGDAAPLAREVRWTE
ncbi:MAG: phage integrase N-terminal SAM-like domain-containing protein [Pseudomonadota bacterium]